MTGDKGTVNIRITLITVDEVSDLFNREWSWCDVTGGELATAAMIFKRLTAACRENEGYCGEKVHSVNVHIWREHGHSEETGKGSESRVPGDDPAGNQG